LFPSVFTSFDALILFCAFNPGFRKSKELSFCYRTLENYLAAPIYHFVSNRFSAFFENFNLSKPTSNNPKPLSSPVFPELLSLFNDIRVHLLPPVLGHPVASIAGVLPKAT
jgi:hypothetical protein